MENLPIEILELICNSSSKREDKHFVRAQLRSTCLTLRTVLRPESGKWTTEDRAQFWILNGASYQWILEKKLAESKNIMKFIAFKGDLEMMKDAHENGCPWNKWTCWWAEETGHLDCLQYARDHGCPEN